MRQQIIILERQIKRPHLTNQDRLLFILLSRFTKFWEQSIHSIQPDTLLRWHRELFRWHWRRKSQGQPKISPQTIALIRKMTKENPLWGAERIRGELWYVFVMMELKTPQIIRARVTKFPTDERTAQPLREATAWGGGPKYLIHDRDSQSATHFSTVAIGSNITEMKTLYRTP